MSHPRVAFNARHISETHLLLTTVHAAMLMRLNTSRIEAIDFSQISRSSGSFWIQHSTSIDATSAVTRWVP
jgi:hypothetical protein